MKNITIEDITVHIKVTKNQKTVIAQATLTICNAIEIHGFTISKSKETHSKFQEKIWIQPPRIPPYWKKIVYIQNKQLWEDVEELIYTHFKQLNTQMEQKVDINDIPDNLGSI